MTVSPTRPSRPRAIRVGRRRMHRVTRPADRAPAKDVTVRIELVVTARDGAALRVFLDGLSELVRGVTPAVVPVTAVAPTGAAVPAPRSPRPAADVAACLHLRSRRFLVDGRDVPLSHMEFNLLAYLTKHPDRVFSRTELLAAVWGHTTSGTRTVDVHVRRIRAKIDPLDVVATVPRVGYRLSGEAKVEVLP